MYRVPLMKKPKAKILVVDDEPSILLTLSAILEDEGYDVDAVPGGAEALLAIRQQHYDLVLTDLKMPNVDGLAVLEAVRTLSPQTATIMLTGYGSVYSALEAVRARVGKRSSRACAMRISVSRWCDRISTADL